MNPGKILVVLIFVPFLWCPVSGGVGDQRIGTIAGTVVSSEDQSPLVGANVLIKGTILGGTSSADGRFTIAGVPEGTHTLVASRVGYERKVISNVVVKAGEVSRVAVSLTPLPIQSEPVVVTASKRDQSLEEIPVSVSLVDARTIEERNSVTIDEALRYVPGVNMVQSQVNIRGMSGYSRGIGSRVLLLLDGIPLLTGDTGEIVWETIPPFQIERIEVVKGAGSALYGSNALGGVINVITKQIKEGREGRLRAYGGLYDNPIYDEWRWSTKTRFLNGLHASYSLREGSRAFLLSTSRMNDDGYRENDFYRRWNFFGKFQYDFSPYESATLSFNLLNQKKGSFFWWRSLKQALQSDGDQSHFRITTTRWNANVGYRKIVGEKFSYIAKGNFFKSFLQNDSLGVLGSYSKAHTGFLELQGNFVPSASHILTFGLVGNYNDIGAILYGDHSDVGVALYFQDEYLLNENLRLTGGARYDFQKVLGLRAASQLSPKFGLVYSPDKRTTIRASAGRGFRAPSLGEIYISAVTYAALVEPNPDLKPEHSWSFEVGGNRLLTDQVLVDAAVFWSEFFDLIEGRISFDVERKFPVIKFENLTRARIQGAEVGVKSDWFKKLLQLQASYTYVWPEDRTEIGRKEGKILRFRPRHLLYVGGSLNYKSLTLGGDFRYVSKVDRIDEKLVQLARIQDGSARVPIKVVDLRASLDLTQHKVPVVLRLNVNNVFQYNYVELIGNVAPIRHFVFTAEAKF